LSGFEFWVGVAEKRILNILRTYKVTYTRHMDIKISEAGPFNQRAEPAVFSTAISNLLAKKKIILLPTISNEVSPPKFYGLATFGTRGDLQRFKAFQGWRSMFLKFVQNENLCGNILEKMIADTVIASEEYSMIGAGPEFNSVGDLVKLPGSEILAYDGKKIYKYDSKSGFDVFVIDKNNGIPIGIEAKNIREWLYPASVEIWRTVARACTLECLPVIVSRKISYIATAGFFSHFGILGFQTHFQYFSSDVLALSNYKFRERIIHKSKLGFADIRLVGKADVPPDHFDHFFNKILIENSEDYYKKFLENKDILKKYAIDKGMAENKMKHHERIKMYKEFKKEAGVVFPVEDFPEP